MTITTKNRLLNFLKHCCRGKEKAVTRGELKKILDCDDRTIRELIAELRISGIPITARSQAPGGYFIPQTREEAIEGIEDWRQRARKLYMAAAGVSKGMRRLFPDDQQMILGFGEIINEAIQEHKFKEAS